MSRCANCNGQLDQRQQCCGDPSASSGMDSSIKWVTSTETADKKRWVMTFGHAQPKIGPTGELIVEFESHSNGCVNALADSGITVWPEREYQQACDWVKSLKRHNGTGRDER